MLRRFVKPVGVTLIIILIFMAAGFRINHPQYGLSSALGSAKSSLAIYKHGAQPTVGAKVVVNLPTMPAVSPALGIIRSVQGGKVLVVLGSDLREIGVKDVNGKLIAVIPFLGAILGIVGL
jgi:hypothetical protein